MAMRLEKENVNFLFMKLISEMDHYGLEGKEAEFHASYISGALDMAKMVMEAIDELRGK